MSSLYIGVSGNYGKSKKDVDLGKHTSEHNDTSVQLCTLVAHLSPAHNPLQGSCTSSPSMARAGMRRPERNSP